MTALAGCSYSPPERLQTGDLIFVAQAEGRNAGESTMDGAIAAATGSIIHVALVEVDDDGAVWVIDATSRHGVDRRPLQSFFDDFSYEDGTYPVFTVKRLKDTGPAGQWVERAKSFCGQAYDEYFLPDNGAMYCSELVRESLLDENGSYLVEESPMNFKNADGEFPAYWVELFSRIGADIPQGVPGTNPQEMSASELLVTVDCPLP